MAGSSGTAIALTVPVCTIRPVPFTVGVIIVGSSDISEFTGFDS